MMLSELYGRIGQQLKEYGDARIARFTMSGEGLDTKNTTKDCEVTFTLFRTLNYRNVEQDKVYLLTFK